MALLVFHAVAAPTRIISTRTLDPSSRLFAMKMIVVVIVVAVRTVDVGLP
jgi:hypothetical protein